MLGIFLIILALIYSGIKISWYALGRVSLSEPVITNPVIILVLLGFLIFFFAIIINQFTQLQKNLLIIQKQNKELQIKLKEK